MAKMVPSKCPSASTVVEKRIYALLSNLPDDHVVWYEPHVGDRYPDFAVLGPDFGLLFLEVKDWRASRIYAANGNEVYLFNSKTDRELNQVRATMHPIRQVRDYQMRAMVELKKPEYSILQGTRRATRKIDGTACRRKFGRVL